MRCASSDKHKGGYAILPLPRSLSLLDSCLVRCLPRAFFLSHLMTKLCYQALLLGELKVKHNRHHRPLVWVRQLQWTCPVKVTPEKRLACIFTLFCNINAVYTRSFRTIKLYHQPTHAHRHAVAAALRPSEHNERRSLHDRFDMKHNRALYTWSTAEPRYASIVQRLERNKCKECWCWLWTHIICEHKVIFASCKSESNET